MSLPHVRLGVLHFGGLSVSSTDRPGLQGEWRGAGARSAAMRQFGPVRRLPVEPLESRWHPHGLPRPSTQPVIHTSGDSAILACLLSARHGSVTHLFS